MVNLSNHHQCAGRMHQDAWNREFNQFFFFFFFFGPKWTVNIFISLNMFNEQCQFTYRIDGFVCATHTFGTLCTAHE